ncbi:MAG: hypothetical protein J5612_04670 [Paludibacteraceae bacterium]|nr:hypothetical protein [Paludibacteraceae bacterium]
MKRLFTTLFIAALSLCAMAQLNIWYNGVIVYQRQYAQIDSITFGLPQTTPDPEGNALSPEEAKDYLMTVAKKMVNQFNTADQKAAIDLADGLFVKYKNYEWDGFETYYEEKFDYFFRMPRYMNAVINGEANPADLDRTWLISFKETSAIFEADETTHTWKYLGPSSDNSLIMRCKDRNGVMCEAKIWGEGQTHEYEYTWQMYRWEERYVYAGEGTILFDYRGWGYYDGENRDFYRTDDGRWYYYDYYSGEQIFVNIDDIQILEARDNNWNWYNYDHENNRWYTYKWEKTPDGKRTIHCVLPDKVAMTLKHGTNEIIRLEFEQEMVKNDHAYFSLFAKLANLSWTVDAKVNSTYGSGAFAFSYGNQPFFSIAVNLPLYELIDKKDNQTYEDWIEEYGDRYDELLKKIGEGDAIVDLFGQVQLKAHVNHFGYAYRDYMKWDDQYGHMRTKESVKAFCSIFNDNSTNGIYFNNDVKQAEVRVITAYDEIDESYSPEPVLYFPADGTSYGFEQYFNRKPFTDLQYMVEDLINTYIQTSPSLFDEVGTVEF